MKYFSTILLFLIVINASAQQSDADYVKQNYRKMEVSIPMRDGIKLFTSIYLPKDSTKKYPILMQRTPYSVAPYGIEKMKGSLGPSSELLHDGYIFVYQDVRGRWMSEGIFVEMTPHKDVKNSKNEVDESSDTYDTVDWLIKNLPNNSEKVGQWGISYPGFYASAGLMAGHPALVASSPQAPMANLWRDDSYHNGAFMLPANHGFYPFFTNRTDDKPTQEFAKRFEINSPDAYDYFLKMGGLKNSYKDGNFGNDPYWKANVEHPNYDEFWEKRNILNHHNNIKHAVMVVGGWYDAEDLFGTFNTYRSIEAKNPGIYNIFVVGPWVHGGWARGDGDRLGNVNFGQKTAVHYRQDIERKFFNYFLKGEGDANFPEAQVFETGTNQWRSFDKWPPKEAIEKNIYLKAGEKLDFDSPKNEKSFSEYISDPNKPVPFVDYIDGDHVSQKYMTDDQRFAARRPDVLAFETEILEKDLTLAGNILANLKVATTGTDADFVVKIIDVYPDSTPEDAANPKHIHLGGYQQMVRSEVMRGRFRKNIEKPVPFTPNKIEDVVIELQDILHTFKKGHRLMVQIQSTWFPFMDRNPQKYLPLIADAKPEDFQKATHRIYHSKNSASFIKVRVLE